MRGRRVLLGTVGAILLVLVAIVATSESVPFAERSPSLPWDLTLSAPAVEESSTPDQPVRADEGESAEERRSLIGDILGVIVVAAAALWLGAAIGQRRRARDRGDRRPDDDGFEPVADRLDEIASAVRDDAETQRAALFVGDPRNAIVECWARLEGLLVEAGLERRPSDSSTDLVTRTLGRTDVDPASLEAFAALYREARFSEHPMGDAERLAAVAALDDLHNALGGRIAPDPIRAR